MTNKKYTVPLHHWNRAKRLEGIAVDLESMVCDLLETAKLAPLGVTGLITQETSQILYICSRINGVVANRLCREQKND